MRLTAKGSLAGSFVVGKETGQASEMDSQCTTSSKKYWLRIGTALNYLTEELSDSNCQGPQISTVDKDLKFYFDVPKTKTCQS